MFLFEVSKGHGFCAVECIACAGCSRSPSNTRTRVPDSCCFGGGVLIEAGCLRIAETLIIGLCAMWSKIHYSRKSCEKHSEGGATQPLEIHGKRAPRFTEGGNSNDITLGINYSSFCGIPSGFLSGSLPVLPFAGLFGMLGCCTVFTYSCNIALDGDGQRLTQI